jgi:hypothetical protein
MAMVSVAMVTGSLMDSRLTTRRAIADEPASITVVSPTVRDSWNRSCNLWLARYSSGMRVREVHIAVCDGRPVVLPQ